MYLQPSFQFRISSFEREIGSVQTRPRLHVLALGLLISLSYCSYCSSLRRSTPDFPLVTLSNGPSGLDSLRKEFNKDTGKVRLLLLLDPT